MIKIYVSGQNVSGEYSPIASDSINYLEASFSFSPDWYGLEKTAQFTQNGKTYNVVLEKNKCHLPSELTEGFMDISVFGQEVKGTRRITTLPFSMVMKKSAFVADGDTPVPPTPDLYSQLIGRIEDAVEKIPGKLSEFDNDSGFITADDIPKVNVPTKLSEFDNDSGFITADDIPKVNVPTKLSAFDNDAGFITADDIPDVSVPTKLSDLEADKIEGGSDFRISAYTMSIGASALTLNGSSVSIGETTYGFSVSGNRVQSVGEPEEASDAATKGYVDTLVGNVETALDSIISMQNSLIGGDA